MAKNDLKFIATTNFLEPDKDRVWLKVTNAVNKHWQKNNATKKSSTSLVTSKPLFSNDSYHPDTAAS